MQCANKFENIQSSRQARTFSGFLFSCIFGLESQLNTFNCSNFDSYHKFS
jgi:hypothetical protein